jgi:hypothetical protein
LRFSSKGEAIGRGAPSSRRRSADRGRSMRVGTA